jgi:hypothetical protein
MYNAATHTLQASGSVSLGESIHQHSPIQRPRMFRPVLGSTSNTHVLPTVTRWSIPRIGMAALICAQDVLRHRRIKSLRAGGPVAERLDIGSENPGRSANEIWQRDDLMLELTRKHMRKKSAPVHLPFSRPLSLNSAGRIFLTNGLLPGEFGLSLAVDLTDKAHRSSEVGVRFARHRWAASPNSTGGSVTPDGVLAESRILAREPVGTLTD